MATATATATSVENANTNGQASPTSTSASASTSASDTTPIAADMGPEDEEDQALDTNSVVYKETDCKDKDKDKGKDKGEGKGKDKDTAIPAPGPATEVLPNVEIVPHCCHYYAGKSVLCMRIAPPPVYGRWFPMICMVGPDWPCLICSYSLILVPGVLFLFHIAPEFNIVCSIIGTVLLGLTVLCLTMAACSDPGIIAKQTPEQMEQQAREFEEKGIRKGALCVRCNIYRPMGAVHCYDCDACVMELDHHCPWTGKCIGKNNQRFFNAFLTMLSILVVYVIIFAAIRAFTPK